MVDNLQEMCYNKSEEITLTDRDFRYLLDLTVDEKRQLIKMWKERNNVSEQKKIRCHYVAALENQNYDFFAKGVRRILPDVRTRNRRI